MALDVYEPDSSLIRAATWDDQSREMMVELTNGRKYDFQNIDPALWERFKDADSAGRFWNAELKGRFG